MSNKVFLQYRGSEIEKIVVLNKMFQQYRGLESCKSFGHGLKFETQVSCFELSVYRVPWIGNRKK